MKRIKESYSRFIVTHPWLVILIAVLITIGSITLFARIEIDNPSVDEILPDSYSVVEGIQKLSDSFGGGEGTAFMVVVELNPQVGSKITDIRDPQVLRYTKLLSEQIRQVEDITTTSSLGENIYAIAGNRHTNSIGEIKEIIANNGFVFDRIVNEKYTLTVIRVFANEGFDVEELTDEVNNIIDNTPQPRGIRTQLAGELIANKISEDLTGPDSAKTTQIALIAIIVILLLTFRHFIYGALPLFTIIFGVLWMFGFMGLTGLRMTNFSSGAVSMIVGIGIDFGIQTIMRFKSELEQSKPVLAMQKTMDNVLKPMFITTVASFIGFWSMTFGDFVILGELGKIMALGVVFCFLAAISVVPAISVLFEIHKPKRKLNTPVKFFRRAYLLIRGRAEI